MKVFDWSSWSVCQDSLSLLSRDLAFNYKVFPIFIENGILNLAVTAALDLDAQDALGHVLGRPLSFFLAHEEAIIDKLEKFYECSQPKESVPVKVLDEPTVDFGLEFVFGTSPSQYFKKLMEDAVRAKASDIHLEPFKESLRIRYRIDGRLELIGYLPDSLRLSFVAYIKINANLPIDKKSTPLDGRLSFSILGKSYDLRLAFIPAVYGESLVIRLLDKSASCMEVDGLGLSPQNNQKLLSLLSKAEGLVLVVGPTGAGKTTTLYAALQHLLKKQKKIFTIEDPIEYQVTGLNQVPLNRPMGINYVSALKSILRQSPDIMMIGEIRDLETAASAVNAALTGHLVLSTLHAIDAISAIIRLIDLGISHFLLSAGLRGIIAQRLVRKVCTDCVGSGGLDKASRGCTSCRGTGFRGRIPVFEVLEITPAIEEAIYEKKDLSEIRQLTEASRFISMHADALDKIRQGLTTSAEVETQLG